jgi:cytochrome c553
VIRDLVRSLLIGRAIAVAVVRAFLKPSAPSTPEPRNRSKRIRKRLLRYGVILAVIGALGFLVAASGLLPIRASAGHWSITEWFLEFSLARSVSTHSLGTDVPPLDDPALVVKGAAAYDLNCRSCHGSPDFPHPRVAQAMLPRPPYLPPVIKNWSAAELFYIVKHGLKFTGMPAWPAQKRDDEVWAVVAFLLQFPKLDGQSYQRLVGEERSNPPIETLVGTSQFVIATCMRCHGVNGMGRGVSAFPKLAGQRRTYLTNAMQAYATSRRHSGVMEPVAAALTRGQMQELAAYFSGVEPSAPQIAGRSPDAIARGMVIASRGIPAQDVPACSDCHGPSPRRKNDAYPILAGQFADYLVLQLELFKTERRGGSPYAHLMRPVAAGLTSQQMRDVAAYYESLGAGR